MLCDSSAKVAPRRGETLKNTKAFFRVEGPKERPRDTQNLTKKSIFVQGWCKVDAAFAGGPLGSMLGPSWHPRGSKITKTLYFTKCVDYFLDLWTFLEVLLDFFRIASDRPFVFHEH